MRTKIEAAVRRFFESLSDGGRAAVRFEHLESGTVVEVNGDEAFPAASVIKVPILVEALRQVEAGQLALDSRYTVDEARKVGGSGVLKELHSGLEVTLCDILTLMIVVSDNTATNMAIDIVGLEAVNATMHRLGLSHSALRRKMMGGPSYGTPGHTPGGDNTTTANDVALLLGLLAGGHAVSPRTDALALEIMLRQQVNDRLPLLLPPGTRVAHKTGELRTVRHDAGIVYGPARPSYVLVVLTRDLTDTARGAWRIAELSRDIHRAGCGHVPEGDPVSLR